MAQAHLAPARGRSPWTLIATLAACLAGGASAASAGSCPTFAEQSKGLPTAGEWRTHPAFGDVNGDGHIDLAGMPRKGRGPQVFLGNGKGAWKDSSAGLVIPGFSCGVGVELGDLTGDGHLDLVAADHCNGLFVFAGDGKGGWKILKSVMRGQQAGYDDVRMLDADGDGDRDLVAIGSFRGGITLFLNDGTGKLSEVKSSESGLPDTGLGSDLSVADVNGDGLPDIAAAYTGGIMNPPPPELHRNVLWVSTGPAKYRPATPSFFKDGRTYGIALGDVNSDGRVDIALTRDRTLPLHIFLQQPDGAWASSGAGLPTRYEQRYWGVQLADVDGDGHLDLVASNHADAGLRLWRGDGKGGWQECAQTALPEKHADQRGWGLAVQDVNGDGRADIAAGFGRDGAGSLEVWVQQARPAAPVAKRSAASGK